MMEKKGLLKRRPKQSEEEANITHDSHLNEKLFKMNKPFGERSIDRNQSLKFVKFKQRIKTRKEKRRVRKQSTIENNEHEITITKGMRSNSFIYSSSSSEDEAVEGGAREEENGIVNHLSLSLNQNHELNEKLDCLNLQGYKLPEFVKHIKKPRRLTFSEIRSLHVSEKFVHEAHKMIFYPPNLAFAPKS